MHRFLAVACLALVSAVPARAALNRWSSAGPTEGGRIEALAFDPNAPGTVYAGSYGGVFRSEDHGVTWTAASFGLDGAVVTHLEVDPDHPGTVYVATNGGGFQKSTDGGRNWQVPTRSSVTTFALAPSDPQTLYTAEEDAIVKSTDGGASWELGSILPGEEIIRILEVDPLTPANVYAGTSTGLFRSLDGGNSFAPLPGPGAGSIRDLAIDPADPRILYAATSNGVFKSADRGLTWAQAGLAGQLLLSVAIDPASPSTLLATGFEVFRSTNAGGSWTPLFGGVVVSHAAAFDPSAASTYLIGTSKGLYRSTNGGASWLASNSGLIGDFVEKLAVDPHRPGVLFAAISESGALSRSVDAGASWSRVKGVSGVHAVAFAPKTPLLLYAATNGGILRSQDGGSAWVRVNASETTGNHVAVDPQTPSTLYLTSFFAGVKKSVDGGITWSAAGPDVEDFAPGVVVIAPSAPQTVFAGDFQTGLYKSTDGGATWTAVSGLPEPFVSALAVDPTDADVVYASVSGEGIYKSTNGGTTWSFSGEGLSTLVEGIAIDPSQPSRLYATNSRKGIFRSTDGGATWSPFDDGRLANLAIDQILLDPVNPYLLYAASNGGGVLARADLQPGNSLRLNGDRFLVKMSWETVPGVSGRGQTHALTGDTGYASFFQESNVEVLLKVLDVCGLNGHFWVFAAGLTTVRTDITVDDTQTRAVKIYHNPSGQPFQPIQDVNALACNAAAGTAAAAKEPSAASGPLMLGDGRFQVTAEFVTAPGAAPQPMPGALLTDDAAYLWFFDPNNVEVFLKVVNGCPVNDRFWVFAAGLTNVEVRITVVDTQTGEPKVYVNPLGQAFQPIFDTSAFDACGQ